MPLVLGLFEIIALCLLGLFLIIGVAYDRRGATSPKWWVFFLGGAALIVWVAMKTDFNSILAFVASWELWRPLGLYLIAGLLYSCVEFFLDIRRSAKKYAKAWTEFLNSRNYFNEYTDDGKVVMVTIKDRDGTSMQDKKNVKLTIRELMQHPQVQIAGHPLVRELNDKLVDWTRQQHHDSKYGIIGVDVITDDKGWKIDPVVRRHKLASFIGAWTFFWPFYAVTLFLGDFLSELFSTLADWIVAISKRIVDNAFAGIFTVKS